MRRCCLISPVVLCFALILPVLHVQRVKALAQPQSPSGIDLIVALDQSASMWGIGQDYPATDPARRRIYTTQYLIDYLAFDNEFVNPHRTNRVVVVSFGSPHLTHLLVNLTPLDAEAAAAEAKEEVVAENLWNTSFLSAFELIREVFPVGTDEEVLSGLRHRVIVLITDGGPYDVRELTYQEYFAEIGDYYNSELGADKYQLYVVGIDDTDRYWSDVETYWKDIATEDHVVRVESVDEVNREIVRQICPLLNETGTGSECRLQEIGPHFIQPYARSVSFSFFKYDPDARIYLYRADGSPVSVDPPDPDVLGYQSTPRDELFVLGNPAPGCWRSERVGTGRVDVFTQIVFSNLQMTVPSEAHPQLLPLRLEFELCDSEGERIDELAEYPITCGGILLDPDNGEQFIDTQRIGSGLYSSMRSAETSAIGPYELTILGTTTISEPLPCLSAVGSTPVFTRTFQIPVYTPPFQVTTPISPHLQYWPAESVGVHFVDLGGSPIEVPIDALADVRLSLSSPSGDWLSLAAPKWDAGGYRVDEQLLLHESGTYTVTAEVFDSMGAMVYEGQEPLVATENIEVIRPGSNHPAFAPVRAVEVQLRDLAGNPVAPDPNYPLRLEAEMTWPDGETDVVPLEPVGDGGRYRGSADWALVEPDEHKLELSGYISLVPGAPEETAFVSERVVNVSASLPYFQVLSPSEVAPGRQYPLHRWYLPPWLPQSLSRQPMAIVVELWYQNAPASAGKFFVSDVNQLFEVTVLDSEGEIVVQEEPLSDLTDQGTRFGVSLPELTAAGPYTALIHLAGTVRGGVATEGAWPDVFAPFQRGDSILYLVFWWALTLGALGAVVYFGGGEALNRWRLPRVKGRLIVETAGVGGKELYRWDLNPKKRNHFSMKGKELPASLQLKRISVRHVTSKRAGVRHRLRRRRVGELEEGIQVRAINQEGREACRGTIFDKERLPVRQQTLEGERYQLRYRL